MCRFIQGLFPIVQVWYHHLHLLLLHLLLLLLLPTSWAPAVTRGARGRGQQVLLISFPLHLEMDRLQLPSPPSVGRGF